MFPRNGKICSAANVQSDLKQPLCIYIPCLRGGLQSVQSYTSSILHVY